MHRRQSVVTEPFFYDSMHFWTGATAFPLNYRVPLKHVLFYQAQIGFYLQVRGLLREGGTEGMMVA